MKVCDDDSSMEKEDYAIQAGKALLQLRSACPLVQCITNYVSMDLAANTLLSVGASPAMVHASEEVEDFVVISQSLYINIGTLSEEWVKSMHLVARKANALAKPWILDPVGAGATSFRTNTCLDLIKLEPTVIRGNASEILSLAIASNAFIPPKPSSNASKGVDSTHKSDEALLAAKSLSKFSKSIVAVSGAVDYVTDGEHTLAVSNGVPLLQKITATGCSVTALIASFCPLFPNQTLKATAFALSIFGVAAELALEKNPEAGPGTFRTLLLDSLYHLTSQNIEILARISEFS